MGTRPPYIGMRDSGYTLRCQLKVLRRPYRGGIVRPLARLLECGKLDFVPLLQRSLSKTQALLEDLRPLFRSGSSFSVRSLPAVSSVVARLLGRTLETRGTEAETHRGGDDSDLHCRHRREAHVLSGFFSTGGVRIPGSRLRVDCTAGLGRDLRRGERTNRLPANRRWQGGPCSLSAPAVVGSFSSPSCPRASTRSAADWSPNGRWVAYTRIGEEVRGAIFRIRRDGTNRQNLSKMPWPDRAPPNTPPPGRRTGSASPTLVRPASRRVADLRQGRRRDGPAPSRPLPASYARLRAAMVAQREAPRLRSLRLPPGQKRIIHDTRGRDSSSQNHALADGRRRLPRLVPERPLDPVPEQARVMLVDRLAHASERRESPPHHDDRRRDNHMGKRVFLAGWPADHDHSR